MSSRKIFRRLISLEEAQRIIEENFHPGPIGVEQIPLTDSLGRVLAENIASDIDIPGFDRATMDGFAVRAEDTFGAKDDNPVTLTLVGRVEAGDSPDFEVGPGEAAEVSTGAPIPPGADSVVMVEYAQQVGARLSVLRPVSPGENVAAAGSDIMAGELVLRAFEVITSREIGILAALGRRSIPVFKRPKVAILSTGNELVEAGEALSYGKIYDINAPSLAASVRECGAEPMIFGIVSDDPDEIQRSIEIGLESCDILLTSGSTSAGAGDLLYKIIERMGEPGILVHGLSVKPGKPTVIASVRGKAIIGLPGYPTSALMIFHIIVEPYLRKVSGTSPSRAMVVEAKCPFKIFSAKGRHELLPVHLIEDGKGQLLAFPTMGGSGSITSFSLSDGFIEIPEDTLFLEEGELAKVHLFRQEWSPPDLSVIGSHCIGIDLIIRIIMKGKPGYRAKVINVGSIGGLQSVKRGEADVAGIHLLDEETGEYNLPYFRKLDLKGVSLVKGYRREQGFILPKGNPRNFRGFKDLISGKLRFINRNRGSGTRILLDYHLRKLSVSMDVKFDDLTSQIKGYKNEAKSHSAVAHAILSGRADVGVATRNIAETLGLEFQKIADEEFDFAIPSSRFNKPGLKLFLEILRSDEFKRSLTKEQPGLVAGDDTGVILS